MAKKTVRKARTTVEEEEVVEAPADEVVVETPAKPAPGIEAWLVMVTLFALIAAFVLINMKMKSDFGEGWPF